jgi:formylglycine-generating enzyme required for sulfatase activity
MFTRSIIGRFSIPELIALFLAFLSGSAGAMTQESAFGGVSFRYDPSHFDSCSVSRENRLTAQEAGDGPPVDVEPARIAFALKDKRPLPALQKGPRYFCPAYSYLSIIPLADSSVPDFSRAYPDLNGSAQALRETLVTRPQKLRGRDVRQPDKPMPEIPELSFRNAGQAILAKIAYLDTPAFSGVFFLTQYTQENQGNPVNNEELAFVFQGLTKSGRFGITAQFAVTHPSLPAGIDFTDGITRDEQEEYLRIAEKDLDHRPDEEFFPPLSQLKELIRSLRLNEGKISELVQDPPPLPAGGKICPEARNQAALGFADFSSSSDSAMSVKGSEIHLGNGPGVKMRFAEIPPGSFLMGSTVVDPYNRDSVEWPSHKVNLTGFLIARTEVTQAQFRKITGANPSEFVPTFSGFSSGYANTDDLPVENVSWYEAVEFCNKLSDSQGLTRVYVIDKNPGAEEKPDSYDKVGWSVKCDFTKNGFRLPTEAEWEYACRAGSVTSYRYSEHDDDAILKVYCWFDRNADGSSWTIPHAPKGGPQPVGRKKANAWGLFDMTGNVSEWCWDRWSDPAPRGDQTDPTGPGSDSSRIVRGGRWNADFDHCRSAHREGFQADSRFEYVGFRVVRRKT